MRTDLLAFISSLQSGGGNVVPVVNEYEAFVTVGQSNVDGRVPLVDAPSWLDQANPVIPNVKMWDVDSGQFNNFKLGLNTGASWNATTAWALDMVAYKRIADFLGKSIYVVKRTEGGTPLFIDPTNVKGTWNADYDNIPAGVPKLLQEWEQRVTAAKAQLNAVGKTLTFKSILWYQGGTDVQTAGALDVYEVNLIALINKMRTFLELPNIPFFLITQSTTSVTFSAQLQTIQENVASTLNNVYIITAGALIMLSDNLHVGSESSIYLGETYFSQYTSLL